MFDVSLILPVIDNLIVWSIEPVTMLAIALGSAAAGGAANLIGESERAEQEKRQFAASEKARKRFNKIQKEREQANKIFNNAAFQAQVFGVGANERATQLDRQLQTQAAPQGMTLGRSLGAAIGGAGQGLAISGSIFNSIAAAQKAGLITSEGSEDIAQEVGKEMGKQQLTQTANKQSNFSMLEPQTPGQQLQNQGMSFSGNPAPIGSQFSLGTQVPQSQFANISQYNTPATQVAMSEPTRFERIMAGINRTGDMLDKSARNSQLMTNAGIGSSF